MARAKERTSAPHSSLHGAGTRKALAQAFEGLAAIVQMPEAAAALLLRSSAMAAANGDLETANARVAAARVAAPDDTSALLVIAETSVAPQVDAAGRVRRRRSVARARRGARDARRARR